jgi:hypothetical protein
MALQFLQDLKVTSGTLEASDFKFQSSSFTDINHTSNTHTVGFNLPTNNFTITAQNATNTIAFSGLSSSVIGKSGTIVITNPASVGSLGWAALPATAYTPGGVAISFDTTANKIAVLTYFIAASDKVLINYVGDFGSYPQ